MKKIKELYFLRHCESVFNVQRTKFVQQNKSQSDYLHQLNLLQTDPTYIDIPLSQNGIIQATKLKEAFQNKAIDVVIVSPLIRALQTSQIIFGANDQNQNYPLIIVNPEFREQLGWANDIVMYDNEDYIYKQFKTPQYDWQQMNKINNSKSSNFYWQINHLNAIQQIKKDWVYESRDRKDASLKICELMKEYMKFNQDYIETIQELQQRAQNCISYIKSLHGCYQKVCVISHYQLLSHIIGGIMESKQLYQLKNGQIMKTEMQETNYQIISNQ